MPFDLLPKNAHAALTALAASVSSVQAGQHDAQTRGVAEQSEHVGQFGHVAVSGHGQQSKQEINICSYDIPSPGLGTGVLGASAAARRR